MEKIISELIKAVEMTNWQIDYKQARVNPDFEIIVTYDLYKLLQLNNHLFLCNTMFNTFMGRNIRVTTTPEGYSFWIADRQDIN